jgi:NAD(P)-dependent dehydrogenase (short-subunit alcohol dehydrogenase family)
MAKIILITGCSSGMGLEAALLLAGKGHKVYATLHKLDSESTVQECAKKAGCGITCLELDVTKPATIKKAVDTIIKNDGKIDVLINNAGFGVAGAVETLTIEEFQKQFDVNYFGTLRCIQEVLPYMRKQKSGRIINVSSIAGIFGFSFMSAYVSTKFALEGMSETLQVELKSHGIDVKIVEPGPVATNFNKDMIKGTRKLNENPYDKAIDKFFESIGGMLKDGQTSKDAAQAYVDAVEDTAGQFRFQTSKDAEAIVAKKLKDPKGFSEMF